VKVIKRYLGGFEEVEILPLADLHLGDIHSDGLKIREWLSYIRDRENCFCILNGDLMNTAIKSSISDTYLESLTPMEQLQQCVKLFEPIKEKVLLVTAGNHERRIARETSIDTTLLMAEQLGLGELYAPESALLFVQFGKQNAHNNNQPVLYSIYCVHGSGGGRKEGGKVNRLADLAEIIDADIFVHSHSHLPVVMKNGYYRVNTRHCTVSKVDRLFVNTSSSLEWGGYGEIASFKPNSLETPLIILNGTKKSMKAVL